MSLFSSIGKFAKKAIKTVAPIAATGVFGPVGAALGTVITARQSVTRAAPPAMGFAAALPAVVSRGVPALRSIPGAGRALTAVGGASILKRAFTPGTSPLELPDFTRSGKPRKKYRRINPLNVRAARRAIRRIKAVRKITHEIEKQLPHRRSTGGSCPPKRRKC